MKKLIPYLPFVMMLAIGVGIKYSLQTNIKGDIEETLREAAKAEARRLASPTPSATPRPTASPTPNPAFSSSYWGRSAWIGSLPTPTPRFSWPIMTLPSATPVPTAPVRQNRRVRIINRTSVSIYHLYASNVDTISWEEDVLGDQVIEPGESAIVNIDDGTGHCNFDLKAVLSDRREATQAKFNVCREPSWTVFD